MSIPALIVVLAFAGFLLLELLAGRYRQPQHSRRENWLDLLATSQAWLLAGPLVVYLGAALQRWLLPEHADALLGTPWWLQILAFLIFDDLVQYGYHRATHHFSLLWPLHKFHHSSPFMGVRMIWRNGFFYDLLLPNLYLSGVLVYLGFGQVYLGYFLIKTLVGMAAHSQLRWDAVLYRHRALAPLAWIVERTISTPATHFAHHAPNGDDGIGNPRGNYGNLLFLWDVLFGTARITRRYPERFGLDPEPGMAPDPWYVYIFYPLFRSRRPP